MRKRFLIYIAILAIFISIVAGRTDIESRFVYKILPIVIFYTDFAIPKGSAAVARGPFIFVRENAELDTVLVHELVHCEQWYKSGGFFGFFYKLDADYRVAAETEAFKAQLNLYEEKYRPYIIEFFIKGIGFNEFYKTNASDEQLAILMGGDY